MLRLLRTPEPALSLDPAAWPGPLLPFLQPLHDEPRGCVWIVPTGRRQRALLHEWLRRSERPALVLPGLHTLESFVAQVLEYSTRQRPRLDGTERVVRMAHAWQQATGHMPGPGLVGQLSRFVRDWQAVGLPIPDQPGHAFERALQHYLDGLDADGRLDRMNRVVELAREVRTPTSWPNRLFLDRVKLIVVDGFHLLERVELDLIAALAERKQVLLRLIGKPGQPEWPTLEAATEFLRARVEDMHVIDDDGQGPSALAEIGRRIPGRAGGVTAAKQVAAAAIYQLDADGLREEVEAVAARIKEDFRAAQAAGQPMRLSDVAVVIPGPGYDPLIREVFPRAGLEFNLAGRALLVSTSRPARVLERALELIRSDWRHERLLDLLLHPLVRRRLAATHRLDYLFAQRPRGRRRLDLSTWINHWQRHVDRLGARLQDWLAGGELPEGTARSREQHIASTRELRDSLVELLASLQGVLEPVAQLEAALHDTASAAPLSEFTRACVAFLDALEIDSWLAPPRRDPEQLPETPHPLSASPAVPWVEFEKDQQAYFKLVAILRSLAGLPGTRVPAPGGLPAKLALLQIALSGETYQIRTEDDAGVQLFELREIRALRFQHVYALGLVDGQVPPHPEEGIAANRRRAFPELLEQQEQREREHLYLFRQLFEAAEKKLVLSRPLRSDDQRTLPSKFLSAVSELVDIPPLEAATLVSSPREAARLTGVREESGLLPCAPADQAMLADLQARREDWLARGDFPAKVVLDAPTLMQLVFPASRSFSPSDLETYAACPFRYFGTRVLRLEERDPDQARMHYGLLVHRVLQRLYVELRRSFAGAEGTPLPPIADGQRQRLIDLFEEEWQDLDDGLVPPDLRTLFHHDQGVLTLGFAALELLEKEHGNLLNEYPVRDVHLGADGRGRPVALSGKIDRVDVRRDEHTVAIVIDYKTGRPARRSDLTQKLADGRLIQLLLYAAALRETHGLEVVGGAYLHLSERHAFEATKAVSTVGSLKMGKEKQVPLDVAGGVKNALDMAGTMRDGDFSLTRHEDECSFFCPLRHACRHGSAAR
ncbi:MAG: PD-(D/E)XK nuclease family protein [Gemmataceae bacterium]